MLEIVETVVVNVVVRGYVVVIVPVVTYEHPNIKKIIANNKYPSFFITLISRFFLIEL